MRGQRAFTLIEVLIAIGVLVMIAMLIYGAFSGLRTSKEGVSRLSGRYHEGRQAIARIARELQSAYVSLHQPLDQSTRVVKTAFIGKRGGTTDRLDFNSFSNRRLDQNSHESDQCELSYFGSPNPKESGVVDLVRRISKRVDMEPDKGGRVDVLATDIDLFELAYLDPTTGMWTEDWDSTQATGQPDRLPLQVRVLLVLNGGRRPGLGRGQDTIRFATKVALPINQALSFAVQ